MAFTRLALLAVVLLLAQARAQEVKAAIVTLLMGEQSGYVQGAVALGQSLIDVKSVLDRVCIVTPEVPRENFRVLEKVGWKMVEVEQVHCNHKNHLDERDYDVASDKVKAGLNRWRPTCTKFRAWEQVEYDRVIFLDSDTLVIAPIDDVALNVGKAAALSNATFAASPESFPPDTFNAGFMLIKPDLDTFQRLLQLNEEIGSSEGGDQGVLNNGLCPGWFYSGPNDPECGRLPWIFNVEVAHYQDYHTFRKMQGQRLPAVIHFVSDGKPWQVLAYEYHSWEDAKSYTSPEMMAKLGRQAVPHMMWRKAYFTALEGVEDVPHNPGNDFLARALAAAHGHAPEELPGVQRGGGEGEGEGEGEGVSTGKPKGKGKGKLKGKGKEQLKEKAKPAPKEAGPRSASQGEEAKAKAKDGRPKRDGGKPKSRGKKMKPRIKSLFDL